MPARKLFKMQQLPHTNSNIEENSSPLLDKEGVGGGGV